MSEKIFVTGLGMVSAIGLNVEEVYQNLILQKHGVGKIQYVDTTLKNQVPAAEVKKSNKELKQLLSIPENQIITRTALLGMLAASEALKNSGIATKGLRCGIISATSVGGMDLSEHFYTDFYQDNESGNIEMVRGHDCADSTERIATHLGIKDYTATLSTACSSSANAIMFGARLIRHEQLDMVIAGGTDSLTRFTINGFNTLMILDKEHCKPFDARRVGLNIGEGAGFIVMVSEKVLMQQNLKALARLTGWGNANDAYHQTASSPEGKGAYLAMTKAIEMSGLSLNEINYINVHGTGTSNNDLSEGIAIERIFGDKVPPFSSTKPYTGHTLGAAGGIEAVISILSLQNKAVFPNLNFSEKIPELNICPASQLMENQNISNVLSNSFGFGGNNSTLIFSAC